MLIYCISINLVCQAIIHNIDHTNYQPRPWMRKSKDGNHFKQHKQSLLSTHLLGYNSQIYPLLALFFAEVPARANHNIVQ